MTDDNSKIVNDIYKKFKGYNGSEHIATTNSMMNLLEIIQDNTFCEVLDFGAGIGTISALLLDNTSGRITAIEKNEWCTKEFTKNLLPNHRIDLYSYLPKKHFDLCIIDDLITVVEIMRIFSSAGNNLVVFIEGRRGMSVALFSLVSMFYRYCGSYFEGKRSWNIYGENYLEKAGSYFVFTKSTLSKSVISWLKRIKRIDERDNLKYFFLKKSKLLGIRNKFK